MFRDPRGEGGDLASTPARAKRLAPRPDGPLTHFASPRGEKGRLAPPQPEGELFEAGVGLARGAEHHLAFVFTHRIGDEAGNCPNLATRDVTFRLQTSGPVKNSRQEPRRGRFLESRAEHVRQRLCASETAGRGYGRLAESRSTNRHASRRDSEPRRRSCRAGRAMDYHGADAD